MTSRSDRPALPADLQDFADEISVVQQRIEHFDGPRSQVVDMSRALRRAVRVGRHDLAEGRALLGALTSRLVTRDPLKE